MPVYNPDSAAKFNSWKEYLVWEGFQRLDYTTFLKEWRDTYGQTRLPTIQQFKYVHYLLIGRGRLKALGLAGYVVPKNHLQAHQKALEVEMSERVRCLLDMVLSRYITDQKLSLESILSKAYEVYDHADNVRDQLAALQLISDLAGFTNRRKKRNELPRLRGRPRRRKSTSRENVNST